MFVIPMAGLSSRFFDEGFEKPKYQLMLDKESLFSWSIKSFSKYFTSDKFVFIYRDVYKTKEFLGMELERLGIKDYQLICLDFETKGQADTVYKGIKDLEEDELFIFNIDSKIIDYSKPRWINECDGYLDVFNGTGNHWSFIEIDSENKVIRTTEKERISDLCSSGLYYFRSKSKYVQSFENSLKYDLTVNHEFYIAPLYNYLISNGDHIKYSINDVNNIFFCGTPDEYNLILNGIQGG